MHVFLVYCNFTIYTLYAMIQLVIWQAKPLETGVYRKWEYIELIV
jgi:hypothetical protein